VLRQVTWWLLAGGIVWQAIAGGAWVGRTVWEARAVGWDQRVSGTTDERLQRELGAEFAIVRSLRGAARPGEWVLCRFDVTSAVTDELLARAARLTRLRHALFPTPFVADGLAEPMDLAEKAVPSGGSALLLVSAGEPAPDGRPGWTCVARAADHQVWRLQRP
jgi:hypothetical protein